VNDSENFDSIGKGEIKDQNAFKALDAGDGQTLDVIGHGAALPFEFTVLFHPPDENDASVS